MFSNNNTQSKNSYEIGFTICDLTHGRSRPVDRSRSIIVVAYVVERIKGIGKYPKRLVCVSNEYRTIGVSESISQTLFTSLNKQIVPVMTTKPIQIFQYLL